MANTKAFKVKNGLDLGEYNKAISDTAVDVFVYDTSQDSDGGAWRHRTQGTSWYNETLNTSTRGSRKEFPAVAVIVADSTAAETYIYDGDDPDLPLWMSFDNSANSILRSHGSGMNLAMLNGKLMIGLAPNDAGMAEIDFISDGAFRHTTSGSYANKGNYKGNIAERNSGKGFDGVVDNPIVNIFVNDVAMTVLPNAPIDAATGLPVPTIAVATDGGWSQISDDGNVYDFAFSTNPQVTRIGFRESNGTTLVTWNGDSNLFIYDRGYFEIPLLTSDTTSQTIGAFTGSASYSYGTNTTSYHPMPIGNETDGTNYSIPNVRSGINGLSLYDGLYENRVTASTSSGMVAYVASDYATGWQNGAIKLATLSDTDDTDVTGSELVTNGTFDSDTAWTKETGWSIGSGVATFTPTNFNSSIYQTISGLTVGKKYTFTCTLTTSSATSIRYGAPASAITINPFSGTQVLNQTFTATATTQQIGVNALNGDTTLTLDNVSVRLAEEDRSVNGNGLQVFGTVTKNPVATGADLVAYSGFSASNYLEQPYNSDLDFGTGDFCVMGWVNQNSNTTQIPFWSGYFNGGNHERTVGIISGSSGTYVETYGASGVYSNTTAYLLPLNVWAHVVGLRTNGQLQFFVNGKKVSEATSIHDVSSTLKTTKLGGGTQNNLYPFLGLMALWKVSATAPSPEQIAKIYEDEKFLFQENAQATLYGSSDAVTALAYDDTTELLHVGTSAGRSVFQGLRRVDNTTDAVGAAISASNGLVAED